MIHLIDRSNRHLYPAPIEEKHPPRKVNFVDERGWSGATVRGGGEYDDRDDDRTLHFLALDDDGRVGVSMRARPTDDKCMVVDVFPQLVYVGAADVKDPRCWEISRIYSSRKFRTRAGLRRRDEVFLASMEAAVDHGIARLVGIIDTHLLPLAMRFPWKLKPLGLPAAYPRGEMIGIDIPVSSELLQNAREALAIEGSIFVSQAHAPGVTDAEIAQLLRAGHLPPDAFKAFAELVRDTAALQDRVSEPQLLAMIDRLAAQWRRGHTAH